MNGLSLQRLGAIMRKEGRHIVRDWQTLMIVLAMPVVMMFLYGYALTLDYRDLPVLVECPVPSPVARIVTERIDASTLFRVTGTVAALGDAEAAFRKHRVKAVVRFPASFERDLRRGGRAAAVQVLIDGSDQAVGSLIRNSAEAVVRKAVLDALGLEAPEPVQVRPRVLYNPEQKSALFFVPGLMAIILMMISALLTALSITREKETQTLRQLRVSPLLPREIILGKIIPYIALAAFDGLLVLLVGRLAFGVMVQGSHWLLAGCMLVYIVAALGLGLIISTVAKNQQQAMLMVLPATILPTMILSGFIFPLASMPAALQAIAHVIPATYFLQIIRGIILKGVGLHEIAKPLLALLFMDVLFIAVAVRRFGREM
ncbi:MAG: ABC transporter permease [Fibrobacterota bacterium]